MLTWHFYSNYSNNTQTLDHLTCIKHPVYFAAVYDEIYSWAN